MQQPFPGPSEPAGRAGMYDGAPGSPGLVSMTNVTTLGGLEPTSSFVIAVVELRDLPRNGRSDLCLHERFPASSNSFM